MTNLGIPFLRNSERNDFKSCQAKWHWSWDYAGPGMGLVLDMPATDARWFGTGWHLVWAEYYTPPKGADGFTRGRDPHETWAEFCKNEYGAVSAGPYWDEAADKEWHDAEALGHIMIDEYLRHYGTDPQWEVLMPEQRFKAKIPYNARQNAVMDKWEHTERLRFITTMVGTMDMPIRDHSFDPPRIIVVDHKTTNRKENVRWLTKDDQAGTYITVATGYLRRNGLILPHESVWGALWNYSRKGKPPDPETVDAQGRKRNKPIKKHYIEQLAGTPHEVDPKWKLEQMQIAAEQAGIRVLGDVSAVQPGPLFWREYVERGKANRARQLSRIADDAEQIALIRDGSVAPTKNPGEHCNWCDHSDLCDLDENGDDTEDYIKAVYRIEDKYADHRPDAVNTKATVSNAKRN